MNLYGYCGNDPINFLDPSGLADVNFIAPNPTNPKDTSYQGGQAIPAGGNTFTIAAHGGVGGNGIYADSSGNTSISTAQIISAIDKGGHKPGQTIEAHICYGGVGDNLKAMKKIAATENSPVIVATSEVRTVVGKRTGNYIGSIVGDSSGPGQWLEVSPNGSVSPYSQ